MPGKTKKKEISIADTVTGVGWADPQQAEIYIGIEHVLNRKKS